MTVRTTTEHLLRDSLRRSRGTWALAGFGVTIAWALVSVGFVRVTTGLTASLIAAFALGPVTSLMSVMAREIRYLPATSRDVWVAAWLLSAVFAPLFLAAVQAAGLSIGIAFGHPQPGALPSLTFVALCTVAYGGVLLPLSPLMGFLWHAAAERRPRWLWTSLATLTLIAYLGALVVPWAASSLLPASFADLEWWSTLVLAAGLVAAAATYRWTPQRFGAAGREATFTNRPAAPASRAHSSAEPVVRSMDRLTGVRRLLLPSLGGTFGWALIAVACAAVYAVRFNAPMSVYETFAAWGLLPFSAAGLSPKAIMGTAMIAPVFAIGAGHVWSGHRRHLRVLPLSVAETARLFLVTIALEWIVVWTVLLGIHLLVVGHGPQSLRPELFAYLYGVTAVLAAAGYGRGASSAGPIPQSLP